MANPSVQERSKKSLHRGRRSDARDVRAPIESWSLGPTYAVALDKTFCLYSDSEHVTRP